MSQQDPYVPQPTYTPEPYDPTAAFQSQAVPAYPAAPTYPTTSYPTPTYPAAGSAPATSPYQTGSAYPAAGYPAAGPAWGTPQSYAAGGYQAQPAPGTDSYAVVALVLSLLGLSLFGVIFGHLSLKRIAERGAGGRGLAMAGLVIGYLGMAIGVLYAVLVVGLGASGQLA